MKSALLIALAATSAAGLAALAPSPVRSATDAAAVAPFSARAYTGHLDIMTYNVHGLPWPVVADRTSELAGIAGRLRALHQQGRAPDVVVLQEAFTERAQAIGRMAGYRYVALGPSSDDETLGTGRRDPDEATLEGGARWLKGESLGKYLGSGLAILSDYPVTQVRRMAFGEPDCAGYDCLAAKGAMIARINLPGGRAIEVATTHMNSRGASEVEPLRSDLAWRKQGEELSAFVARDRDPTLPLMLGGDFNVGRAPPRQAGMGLLMARLGAGTTDALRSLAQAGVPLAADARHELLHAKDWQLALAGRGARLVPVEASVPFGNDPGGPLSDHFGYTVRFALRGAPPVAAPIISVRPVTVLASNRTIGGHGAIG